MINKQKKHQHIANIKQQLLLDISKQRNKISAVSHQWLEKTQAIDSGWMLLSRIPKPVYIGAGIIALIAFNRNKTNTKAIFRNGLKWWGSLRLLNKFL